MAEPGPAPATVPEVWTQEPDEEGEEGVSDDFRPTSIQEQIAGLVYDLAELTARIDAMSPEERGELHQRKQVMLRLAKDFAAAIDEAMLEVLESGGEALIATPDGMKRLYPKIERRTKCPKPDKTLIGLLDAANGDFDAVARCLSSNAWKPAACKAVLGEAWGEHFTVSEVLEIKEGSARKRIGIARDAMEDDDGDE